MMTLSFTYSFSRAFRLTFFITILTTSAWAQTDGTLIDYVGSTRDGSAVLDVRSSTQGILVPRMDITQRNAISSPATGLLIFQTNSTPGYYYNSGTPGSPVWERLVDASGSLSGSGTLNYVPKWTPSGTQLGNSQIFDNGTNVGIGNTSTIHQLSVGVAPSDVQAVTVRGHSNTPGSWKGGAAFGYTSAAVIMGELGGVANIGGHSSTLNAWADLAINVGGGNVGVGLNNPGARLTVRSGATDPGTTDNGKTLFVSGSFGSGQTYDGGVEFRHDNLTQGIGFGYNTIYQTGTNANETLNLIGKGTGAITLNAYGGATGNVGIGITAPQSTLHVMGKTNIHQSGSGGGQNRFEGLDPVTSANGRAQLVLSSAYSDLVVASSQANDNHGSTISLATYDPSNAASYRKWVINQGNWGTRSQFLDFGYAVNISNPHGAINSGNTTMTLDGTNRRVGVANISPSYNLDVAGKERVRRGGFSLGNANEGQIEVSNAGSGDAFISFHREGVWGAHFGLAADNWFSTLGWSAGGGFTSMRVGSFVANGSATVTNLAGGGNRIVMTDNNGALYPMANLNGSGLGDNLGNHIATTAIQPVAGATPGIDWADNAFGGGGDNAYIQYYSEGGENSKLRILNENDADDDIEFYQAGGARLQIINGEVHSIANFRAPIMYDYNDANYYTNPNGTTRLYNMSTLAGFDGFYPSNSAIRMTPNFHFNTPAGNAMIVNWDNGAVGGGTQQFRVGNGTGTDQFYVRADGQFFGRYFADLDDGGYYLDPNSTSREAQRIRGGTLHGPNPSWGKYLSVGANGREWIDDGNVASVVTTDGNLHMDAASGHGMYLNYYDGDLIHFGRGNNTIRATMDGNGLYLYDGWLRPHGDNGLYFQDGGTGLTRVQADGGQYGSVSTYGSIGGWEGYSIDGRFALMAQDNGSEVGLYNDVDNMWAILYNRLATNDGFRFFNSWSGALNMRIQHTNGSNYASYDGDNNWDFYSDRRLKENIENESNILERLLKLDVVNYDFIKRERTEIEKEKGIIVQERKDKEIGFIAQDVEQYFPSLVSESDDDRYDFKVKALGYSSFGVLAIGGIKELKIEKDEEIAGLNKTIAVLQEEVEELRNLVNQLLEKKK